HTKKLRQMSTGGTACDSEARRIDLILGRVGAQPAHRRFHVMDGGGELVLGCEPITRGGGDETILRQLHTKGVVAITISGAKTPAVNAKHDWPKTTPGLRSRQIEL